MKRIAINLLQMKRISEFIGIIKAHQGKKVLGKALSVSALNQLVSSGTNFVLGIYLVRMLPPAEFGLYGIGFAISLFYFGIGNSLFLTQMVVHMPDRAPEARVPYAGRMFLLVALFCTITLLLFTLLLAIGGYIWESVVRHAEFASAIMTASVTYLFKDFFVRHAYNVRRESWALSIHGAIACIMAILLWLHHLFVTSFSAETALWIYALAQVSGAILGYLLARLPVAGHQVNTLFGDLRESWHGGKWASITNLVYFARTQAHTIVVVFLLGPIEVAKLNATRLLVTPATILTPALSQIAMPRLASAREQGERRLIVLGRLVALTLLTIALFYCVILLGNYDFIVDIVLEDSYQDLFVITALWCLYTCLLAIRNSAEMIGQVRKEFIRLSSANTFSAFVSLAATYWLTFLYGVSGALMGLIVGEIILIILFYRFVVGSKT